ncbi:unnamed protein product [Ectocarpus sp. CCAP 1310/34]|nr:unnamed protein product [Ectocarpus sp. CCAP 1310/34]
MPNRYIRLKEQTPRCHICQETIGGVERLKAHYLSHETIARVYGPSRQRNASQVDHRSIPESPLHEQRHLGRADPRSQQGSWRRGHCAPQTRVEGAQYQSTRNNEFPQGPGRANRPRWAGQGGCSSTRNRGERDWGNARRRVHQDPTGERRGPGEGEAREIGSWRDKRGQGCQWRQEGNEPSGGARGGGERAETRRYTPTWGTAGDGTREGGGGGATRKAEGLGKFGVRPVQDPRRIPLTHRGLRHPRSPPSTNLDKTGTTCHSHGVPAGMAAGARNADAIEFPLYKDQAPQPVSRMPWLKQHMLDGPLRGFLEQYYNNDDDEEGHEWTGAKILSNRHLHSWKAALFLFLMYHTNEQIQGEVFYMDENMMVTYDGFPKGKFHLLVVPRETFLNVTGPSALRKEHLPKLRRLHAMGAALAKALSLQVEVRELSHPSANVIR